MVALAEVLDRFRAWDLETQAGKAPIMDKSVVHKHHQQNAFISRFERVDDDHPDDVIGQLHLDSEHPFFFEHPLDHYPGLMLVEAGRQFGTAVAHLLYGVPSDTSFILNGLRVDFTHFAELGKLIHSIESELVPQDVPSVEWFKQFVDEVYRSRCVVCHMNPLSSDNVKMLQIRFRQWQKQIANLKP